MGAGAGPPGGCWDGKRHVSAWGYRAQQAVQTKRVGHQQPGVVERRVRGAVLLPPRQRRFRRRQIDGGVQYRDAVPEQLAVADQVELRQLRAEGAL